MTEAESLAKLMYTEYARRKDALDPIHDTVDTSRGEPVVLDRLKLRPRWEVLTTVEQSTWYHVAETVLVQYEHKPVLRLKYDDQENE